MNGSTALWTAAVVIASSWLAFEVFKRAPEPKPEVEEVGESNVELEPEHHPLVQQAINERNVRAAAAAAANDPDHDNMGNQEAGNDIGAEWDNDDRARRALEERQAQGQQDEQRINAWKQKATVGTKKARSLERRDRRRAYFEYVRQEAERQRQRIQLEEDMFGDIVAEEREQRQRRIEEAKHKLEESNRLRRENEEQERMQRTQRRDRIKNAIAENGIASLEDDDDIEIADELSGVLVLESGDFAVSVTQHLVERLSELLKSEGRLSFEQVQNELPNLY